MKTRSDTSDSKNSDHNPLKKYNLYSILSIIKKDSLFKLSSILAIIGLLLIVIAEIGHLTSDLGTITLTIGATLIVSAITPFIVSFSEKEYHKLLDDVINQSPEAHEELKAEMNNIFATHNQLINSITELKSSIDSINKELKNDNNSIINNVSNGFKKVEDALKTKVDLAEEASACGIVRIFKCRHNDEDFEGEVLKQFEQVGTREVFLMANSFRDLFGTSKHRHREVILKMLKRDVIFKVLLLDPTSEAAILRAFVEEGKKRSEYLSSSLFGDIESISRILNKLISENKKGRTNMQVRFSPFAPTTYLIITDKYTFVEQYHNGGSDIIRERLADRGINCDCFGGFAPVIMYENSCFFSKLMRSHFENTWNSELVSKKDLAKNKYYDIIENFRAEFHEKSREISIEKDAAQAPCTTSQKV